jgi:hypothetical protein
MSTRGSKDTDPLVRIPRVVAALQRSYISHRMIEAQSPEAEGITDWIESHFPFIGSQINWPEMRAHQCVQWSTAEDLVESFERMTNCIPAATLVMVAWSDALCPSLEIRLDDVLKIAAQIFEASFDTWIINQEENWCIEAHHEGTLSFGHGRPDLPVLDAKQAR